MDSTGALWVALGNGIAGWAIENALSREPRQSRIAPGLPFLPVYAAGGALVATLAPTLKRVPFWGQAVLFGGILGTLEAGAGVLDRATGGHSWGYGPDDAVVDLPHAAAWGILGAALGKVLE